MERVWGTLKKRLPPLLRIEAPADLTAANCWLAKVYMAQHNERFAVTAAEEGSAFVPFVGDLDNTLCVQEGRVVAHDTTVRYERRVLQISEQSHRRHFVKAKVRVHEYPDGTLAIFHGPRRLAATLRTGRRTTPVPSHNRPRKSAPRLEPGDGGDKAAPCPPPPRKAEAEEKTFHVLPNRTSSKAIDIGISDRRLRASGPTVSRPPLDDRGATRCLADRRCSMSNPSVIHLDAPRNKKAADLGPVGYRV